MDFKRIKSILYDKTAEQCTKGIRSLLTKIRSGLLRLRQYFSAFLPKLHKVKVLLGPHVSRIGTVLKKFAGLKYSPVIFSCFVVVFLLALLLLKGNNKHMVLEKIFKQIDIDAVEVVSYDEVVETRCGEKKIVFTVLFKTSTDLFDQMKEIQVYRKGEDDTIISYVPICRAGAEIMVSGYIVDGTIYFSHGSMQKMYDLSGALPANALFAKQIFTEQQKVILLGSQVSKSSLEKYRMYEEEFKETNKNLESNYWWASCHYNYLKTCKDTSFEKKYPAKGKPKETLEEYLADLTSKEKQLADEHLKFSTLKTEVEKFNIWTNEMLNVFCILSNDEYEKYNKVTGDFADLKFTSKDVEAVLGRIRKHKEKLETAITIMEALEPSTDDPEIIIDIPPPPNPEPVTGGSKTITVKPDTQKTESDTGGSKTITVNQDLPVSPSGTSEPAPQPEPSNHPVPSPGGITINQLSDDKEEKLFGD